MGIIQTQHMKYIKTFENQENLIYKINDYVYVKNITSHLCKIIRKYKPTGFPGSRWDYVVELIDQKSLIFKYILQDDIIRNLTSEEIDKYELDRKYIKTLEDNKKPQVGDYIIFRNKIGEIITKEDKLESYTIRIEDEDYFIPFNKVEKWAKNKKDLEIYIDIKKFNL